MEASCGCRECGACKRSCPPQEALPAKRIAAIRESMLHGQNESDSEVLNVVDTLVKEMEADTTAAMPDVQPAVR